MIEVTGEILDVFGAYTNPKGKDYNSLACAFEKEVDANHYIKGRGYAGTNGEVKIITVLRLKNADKWNGYYWLQESKKVHVYKDQSEQRKAARQSAIKKVSNWLSADECDALGITFSERHI